MEENKSESAKTEESQNAVPIEDTVKKPGLWKSASPGRKVKLIIYWALMVIVLFFIVTLIFPRTFYGNEFADTYLQGHQNAFELFGASLGDSAIRILLSLATLAISFIVVFFINFFINLFTFRKTNKTRTVGSLARSCIRYLAVLIDIAIILSIWGVDVASIVAGLGVLTLIIGLGCQSLIQDIVSGLFIVFDNYYSVGDIVIIDGFRGTVCEIGLRTTKIIDYANNVKSITNSNVGTVTNLSSRGDSAVCVDMGIGFNEDIRRVEAVIAEGLPKIKEKIPAIVGDIDYKGLNSFTDAGINLLFLCYTDENNRFQVGRDLKRELYLLFVDNDITIPFNQIVINQADNPNKPRASKKQVEEAERINNKNRSIPDPESKKKKKGRFKESFDETVQMFDDDSKK